MATIAALNILLKIDDQATAGLEKSKRNLQDWGASLQRIGAGLTASVTAPVLGMAAMSVKAASDLQESMSAVGEVYDNAASTVIQRSLEAAQAVGLSQEEYLSTAAVLGVYGDTLGMTSAETADFSNSLITAAADLGSFYNANTPEVLSAMQAALRGEFDPLERFGIMMNMAALEQHALEQGIWDGNGALTTQQRILAAQSFIMANMGNATGDFARTSNGLANSQKILRAQLKNVAAQMGQVLLPTITRAVTIFRELLTRFQGISPAWQRWIVLIALAAAAVGPLLLVLGTFLTLLPAIGAALAVLTGPIGLVVAAIALLTAAYIGNWWGFRDAVDGVAGSVVNLIDWLGEIEVVRSTVSSAVDAISGLFDRITDAIGKVGSALLDGDWRRALAGIGDLLAAPAKAVGDFLKGLTTGFDPLDRLLTLVGSQITGFGRLIQEVFQGDFSGAFDVLKRMVERVPEIFKAAFDMIPWGDIGAAISTAIQALPGLITNASTVLHAKGVELLTGLIDGVGSAIPGLTALLSVLWSVAQTAVGDLSATLYSKGKQLLGGLWSGWTSNWQNVVDSLSALGTDAASAVGDLAETLYKHGKDLVAGLVAGFGDRWATARQTMGRLGEAAALAVGDLGSTLWSAGTALVQGLINGINSMIEPLRNALSVITGLIPDWKGPASRDATLLFDNGTLIMGGLIAGIESQIPTLRRSLAGITDDMDGSLSSRLDASSFLTQAATAATGLHVDRFSGQGESSGGFNNYGIYQEADRYWAPEQTLRARAMQGRRR